MEQQQVSKNYKEDMGPGTEARHNAILESENQKKAKMLRMQERAEQKFDMGE